jgi:hypothetical protein
VQSSSISLDNFDTFCGLLLLPKAGRFGFCETSLPLRANFQVALLTMFSKLYCFWCGCQAQRDARQIERLAAIIYLTRDLLKTYD